VTVPSFLIIPEEVDGVLVEVLPPVVIAHHGLRVLVLRHHLHLPVGEPRLQRPRDGRPPEVVRGEVSEPGVVRPLGDNLLHHPRRERLVEVERAVVRVRLEEVGVLPARVRDLPALPVQLQIMV